MDDIQWLTAWEVRAREVVQTVPYVSLSDDEVSQIEICSLSTAHWFSRCNESLFRAFDDFWEFGWIVHVLNARTAARWLLHQAAVFGRELAVERTAYTDSELKEGIFGCLAPPTWPSFERFLEAEVHSEAIVSFLNIEQCLLLSEWITFAANRTWYFEHAVRQDLCLKWRSILEETIRCRLGYG